ncbi:MAG: hypothetical protein MUO73_04980 [Thermoplasmata archaeon]|nr:hypothetical protein [Thermoplasmata archaeon]
MIEQNEIVVLREGNMKKQLMIVGIIVILLIVGLSGCTNKETETKYSIVGTWTERENTTNQMIFNKDGTYTFITENGIGEGTYTINSTEITVITNFNSAFNRKYRFLSENILALKLGQSGEVIYDRT